MDHGDNNNRKLLHLLSLILISYPFEREALIGGPAPDFTNIEEVTSLLKTLIASTDDKLRFITDVDASSVIPLTVNNETQSTNHNVNED